jgi:hypothetical protein
MLRLAPLIATALCLLASGGVAWQAGAQHMAVSGGDVLLEIDPEANGKKGTRERDQRTQLVWSAPSQTTKITVETFCPGQRFDLTLRAKGISSGKSAGTVTLRDGAWPVDLIRDVRRRRSGKAKLEYEATIGPNDTAGVDYHRVVFVMTAQ